MGRKELSSLTRMYTIRIMTDHDRSWTSSASIRVKDVDVVFLGPGMSGSACLKTFSDFFCKIILPAAAVVQFHDGISLRSEALVPGLPRSFYC